MAYFAEVNNGEVVRVLAVSDKNQHRGQDFLANDLELGGTWIQTSYNTIGGVHTLGGTPLHKNYAGIGYSWDEVGFAAPKPYTSWILNQDSYIWEAPISYPNDGKMYSWNEELLEWKETIND